MTNFNTLTLLDLSSKSAKACEQGGPIRNKMTLVPYSVEALLLAVRIDEDVSSAKAIRQLLYHHNESKSGVDISVDVPILGAQNVVETPFHIAASLGHLASMQALVAAGADPSIRTSRGDTAAHIIAAGALKAAEHQDKESVINSFIKSLSWVALLAKGGEKMFHIRNADGYLPQSFIPPAQLSLYSSGVQKLVRNANSTIRKNIIAVLFSKKSRDATLMCFWKWRTFATCKTYVLFYPSTLNQEEAINILWRKKHGSLVERAQANLDIDIAMTPGILRRATNLLNLKMQRSEAEIDLLDLNVLQQKQQVGFLQRECYKTASKNLNDHASLDLDSNNVLAICDVSTSCDKSSFVAQEKMTCTNSHNSRDQTLLVEMLYATENLKILERFADARRSDLVISCSGIMSVINNIKSTSVTRLSSQRMLEKYTDKKGRSWQPSKKRSTAENIDLLIVYANTCKQSVVYHRDRVGVLQSKISKLEFVQHQHDLAETEQEMMKEKLQKYEFEISKSRALLEKHSSESEFKLSSSKSKVQGLQFALDQQREKYKKFEGKSFIQIGQIESLKAQIKSLTTQYDNEFAIYAAERKAMEEKIKRQANTIAKTSCTNENLKDALTTLEISKSIRKNMQVELREARSQYKLQKEKFEELVSSSNDKVSKLHSHYKAEILKLSDAQDLNIRELNTKLKSKDELLREKIHFKELQLEGQQILFRQKILDAEAMLSEEKKMAESKISCLTSKCERVIGEKVRLESRIEQQKSIISTMDSEAMAFQLDFGKERESLRRKYQDEIGWLKTQNEDSLNKMRAFHEAQSLEWNQERSTSHTEIATLRSKLKDIKVKQIGLLSIHLSRKYFHAQVMCAFHFWRGRCIASSASAKQMEHDKSVIRLADNLTIKQFKQQEIEIHTLREQLMRTEQSFVAVSNAAETKTQAYTAEIKAKSTAFLSFRQRQALQYLNICLERTLLAATSKTFRQWKCAVIEDKLYYYKHTIENKEEEYKLLNEHYVSVIEKIQNNFRTTHSLNHQRDYKFLCCSISNVLNNQLQKRLLRAFGTLKEKWLVNAKMTKYNAIITQYQTDALDAASEKGKLVARHDIILAEQADKFELFRRELHITKNELAKSRTLLQCYETTKTHDMFTMKKKHLLVVLKCYLHRVFIIRISFGFRQWLQRITDNVFQLKRFSKRALMQDSKKNLISWIVQSNTISQAISVFFKFATRAYLSQSFYLLYDVVKQRRLYRQKKLLKKTDIGKVGSINDNGVDESRVLSPLNARSRKGVNTIKVRYSSLLKRYKENQHHSSISTTPKLKNKKIIYLNCRNSIASPSMHKTKSNLKVQRTQQIEESDTLTILSNKLGTKAHRSEKYEKTKCEILHRFLKVFVLFIISIALILVISLKDDDDDITTTVKEYNNASLWNISQFQLN